MRVALKTVDATTASARGEKLIGEIAKPAVSRTSLTQRELSVLKLASDGITTEEIAGGLSLGVETVRSHFKKAKAKLRARNRTHAVAEAMRQLLIARVLREKHGGSGATVPPACRLAFVTRCLPDIAKKSPESLAR